MAKRRSVKRSTGIYEEQRETITDPEETRASFKRLADRASIDWQLEQIESAALGVLEEHGARVEQRADGWRVVRDLADDAEPIAKDAKHALHWIDELRQMLAKGDARQAALAGLQLGYAAERTGVRRFERFVARGRGNLADLSEGRSRRSKETEARDAQIRRDVQRVLDANPKNTKTYAMEQVAAEHDCSVSTVKRAMARGAKKKSGKS